MGENDELISLVQQPAELEEAVGETRMVKSREEEDMSVLEVAHHSFCFSPPKRDRKLSDEEQQETKRPKSPEREGVQLAEEMQTDMREIRYPVVGFGFERQCIRSTITRGRYSSTRCRYSSTRC